jgi:hypothetical protein
MEAGEQGHQNKNRSKTYPMQDNSNRRQCERRQQESEGYTYITMVGWLDRREKIRRRDEELDLW